MIRKLTDEQKLDAAEKYRAGNYTCVGLGKIYNVSYQTVIRALTKLGVSISSDRSEFQRKYTLDQTYFDVIDTEEKAYFLGLLYADGYNHEKETRVRISLQDVDREILEKFNIAIGSNRPLLFQKRKNKNPNWKDSYRVDISSARISKSLAKLGCVQAKSMILEFPTEDQVPKHLQKDFIRGYFDGDGCFTTGTDKNGWRYYAVSFVSTYKFCEKLKDILKQCSGVHFNLQLAKNKKDITTSLASGGRINVLKFLNWLYKDATIYMNRKHAKYIKFLKEDCAKYKECY